MLSPFCEPKNYFNKCFYKYLSLFEIKQTCRVITNIKQILILQSLFLKRKKSKKKYVHKIVVMPNVLIGVLVIVFKKYSGNTN